MTIPIQPVPDPRILANLQRLKDAGAGEDALNAYLAEEAAKPARPNVDMAKVRARQDANDTDRADAATATPGTAFLGGVSALLRHIPGGEAAQAGARSLASHVLPGPTQDYTTALRDIRGAEADNPMSGVMGLLGSGVAAAAMPSRALGPIAAPVVGGAGYGLLSGALQPEGDVGTRAKSAAIQGGTGALLSALLPVVSSYAKSKITPKIDVQQVARDKTTSAVDNALYGAAKGEGAGLPASPVVAQAFKNPITADYVKLVKEAPQYANADDATVLREAYKLMSRDQGGHATFMQNNGFDAARQLKMDAIGSAKKELLDASGSMMPSFPIATKAHALAMREGEAGQNASDVTQRILTGAHIRGDNLPLKSPAQFAEDIKGMTKDEALASIDMMLGRAKEHRGGATKNPLTLFGTLSAPLRMAKLQPYLDLLAQQAGRPPIGQTARAAGLSAMTGLFGP